MQVRLIYQKKWLRKGIQEPNLRKVPGFEIRCTVIGGFDCELFLEKALGLGLQKVQAQP